MLLLSNHTMINSPPSPFRWRWVSNSKRIAFSDSFGNLRDGESVLLLKRGLVEGGDSSFVCEHEVILANMFLSCLILCTFRCRPAPRQCGRWCIFRVEWLCSFQCVMICSRYPNSDSDWRRSLSSAAHCDSGPCHTPILDVRTVHYMLGDQQLTPVLDIFKSCPMYL